MLPAHEGELPEDTQGKDPAEMNVGALVLGSWSGSWCLGREQSKRGRDFPQAWPPSVQTKVLDVSTEF